MLREVYGAKADWAPMLNFAELGGFAPMSDAERAALMVQAGRMAWRDMGDAATARTFFAEVGRVFPENEELAAYAAEFGDPAAEAAAAEVAAPVAEVPVEAAPVEAAPVEAAPVEAAPVEAAAVAEAAAPEPVAPAVEETPAAPVEEPTVDPELAGLEPATIKAMEAAQALEGSSADKAIDAWRKVVTSVPTHRAPRKNLIRVLRQIERWNALADAIKDEVDKVADLSVEEKVEKLFELVEIYKDRLRLDSQIVNTYNAIITVQPTNTRALDALAAQYETMKRWPDLISTLQKKAAAAMPVASDI